MTVSKKEPPLGIDSVEMLSTLELFEAGIQKESIKFCAGIINGKNG
jgi:hypothetical protein